MEDRYMSLKEGINRLLKEKEKYDKLYIAFDFDNTIYDYHKTGDTFKRVEKLLIKAKQEGHILILFSVQDEKGMKDKIEYCSNRGYKPDYVNCNPEVLPNTAKPYFNILLDDRAGLGQSVLILEDVLCK